MRYIGNKESLINSIYQVMLSRNILGKSFFDVFSGTTSVAKFFKKLNYKIISSDLMYYSYVLQKAYIDNNSEPEFLNLKSIIDFKSYDMFSTPVNDILNYLNKLEQKKGFIYSNYTPDGTLNLEQPRMYYTGENGAFIDKVRTKIEEWYINGLLTENEYFILIASLIETVPFYANISGVYAAFHKKWDSRALKSMYLREPEIIINSHSNKCYQSNSLDLLEEVEADIFYLDPPYNQRQYAPNYHLLETIAKYDNPEIKGVSGMRDYSNQKSRFCNAYTALNDLERFVKYGKYKHLILSYNNEGIMPEGEIIEVLKTNHNHVEIVDFDYLRFKSNNNGYHKDKKFIKERLYIVSK
ncbi:DNA adenine methylase [Aggregatibacter actinomycetemcomitans]|uniref:DNA adenine methylase n=1 Tax=Aggregatibacter actinomycetemcomitans TaxID=714 RepID=UPI0011DAB668|nr:DNA adenine methylase [Aggregatibacter actinomycetemcomitans]TYA13773.1 DNA methyltransferase [Aggregatibacter actinomycetemcomitans]TYA32020.1 DNA methyltransferase [Aggregatibacter actinomycetemcomitans]TYA98350.1 DNA methyltransferase [Aggregatibacter actinomycetemcomitans]TYB13322.1 DNA methyltransferase [Aggregatibacter actinomycetemcomitans]TYB13841.1 DNA methyltransferase [Aggregatibacter actinomycetemcomitans]